MWGSQEEQAACWPRWRLLSPCGSSFRCDSCWIKTRWTNGIQRAVMPTSLSSSSHYNCLSMSQQVSPEVAAVPLSQVMSFTKGWEEEGSQFYFQSLFRIPVCWNWLSMCKAQTHCLSVWHDFALMFISLGLWAISWASIGLWALLETCVELQQWMWIFKLLLFF